MNKLKLALLLLIVLISTGCCPKQVETLTKTKDSISYREVVKIDTFKVKADTIHEAIFLPRQSGIDCDSFLPINKFYRSGRANLKVELDEKGNLNLTATCDSLEHLILSKTTEIRSLKEQLSKKTTVKKQLSKLPIIIHLFIYFLLIILLLVLLKFIFKKYIV